jgi:HEAT repeat protein
LVNTWGSDPRLKPTPDYGSLGPGSDLQVSSKPTPLGPQQVRLRVISAALVGVLVALVVVAANGEVAKAAWEQISQFLSLHGKPEPASPAIMSQHEIQQLNSSSAQSQAELLLERAINHYDGANDEIAARVDQWRGKIKLNSKLNPLFTTALNSNDLRVRAAAIEIDLAAYNVAKTPESAERFAQQASASDKRTRVWGLWMLGLLANRGVEPERANEILVSHLQDPDPEIRMWAVEGLSYLGTDNSIAPLLKTFHDDSSPAVRERAACGLAQSGMLSQEQRRTAIPQLLDFLDDASLEANTREWVYHALRDITGQNLPNDPAAWRNWYSASAR